MINIRFPTIKMEKYVEQLNRLQKVHTPLSMTPLVVMH